MREAAALGANIVNLTGGEPMLHRDMILTAVQAARASAIRSRVTTSAYWATSLDRALDQLAPLSAAGLDQLAMSSSTDHQDFVPPDRLVNATVACRRHGLVPLLVVASKGGGDAEVAIRQAFASQGVVPPQAFISTVVPFGRAKDRLDDTADWTDAGALVGGCPSVLRNPNILPGGTVVACGSVFGGQIPVLQGAPVQHGSLGLTMQRLSESPVIRAIKTQGPVALCRLVEKETGQSMRPKYAGICHACGDLLSNSTAVEFLTRRLTEELQPNRTNILMNTQT